MNRLDFIPAMLFGVALGVVLTLGVRDPQRLPISLIPSLVTAMTTVVVGWWIHTAVRQRGELDRIQIDYVSDLNQRIRELITACFGAHGEERVARFRQLSIEISHLRELAHRSPSELGNLENNLIEHYVGFKKHLTDADDLDTAVASRESGGIRITAVKIQWSLCKKLLEQTTETDMFAAN